ncbi:MAG: pyruvate formate lyase family protein [Anaerovoracaceae bacterium]|jgi:pyruvate formate-lyase/glycerol dehydratase family glycyl radical enzyme
MSESSGAKLGLEIRDGKIAKVGSTKRIQELNGMLHAERPNGDIFRAKVLTKVYKETEGQPQIRRRYKASAELYRTIKPVIYDYERLAGWPASRIRGVQIAIEMHAHWLADDLDNMETRPYDPFQISEEDKKELRDELIPYWKDKTLTSLWSKYIPEEEAMKSQAGGFADVVNYITSHGSHFLPDYPYLMEHGFKGKYDLAKKCLEELDPQDPASIDKKEFYEGLILVLEGIKQMAENYADAAKEKASQEKDPIRRQELLAMEECMRHVPWNPPRNFYEAIEVVWLVFCMLFIEGAGPSVTYGRFDQYMYPFYKKGIEDGSLTPELAMEFIEELYIKTTSNPWFQSTNLAYYFGGYYRYPHIDVGGLDKNRRDASNELSFLCLRAMRHAKTTAPTISLLLHQKTPDDLLLEAVKLASEGMGHPSFFNVESLIGMLENRAGGLHGKSPYTQEQILELGSPIGCVEPGVMGYQYGHTDSCIINVAYAPTLVLTHGIKPEGVDGYGSGQMLSYDSGDLSQYNTYEDFLDAVKGQIEWAIKNSHKNAIIAEKILAEQFQLPTYTLLLNGAVEKGLDAAAGGALCNVGPTIQLIGFGTLVDSVAAIKKVIYDDKSYSLEDLKAAIDANYEGYEDLKSKLDSAPKYGNDDDYVDNDASMLWKFFADTTRGLKNYRGGYCDPAVQMVQAHIGFGAMTGATPNGRLAGQPLSDTMSATQQADTKGPTFAARSYGKLNYPIYSNGTLLNMWISNSELIAKK